MSLKAKWKNNFKLSEKCLDQSKMLALFLFILIAFSACNGDQNFYHGIVRGEDGKPILDVFVVENKDGKNTRTDSSGYFRIEKDGNTVNKLIFSKEHYITDTISSANQQQGKTTTVNFLSEDTTIVILKKTIPAIQLTIPPNLSALQVGITIMGDFDGDGVVEKASAVRIKKGEGNPVEDGTPDEYEIQFSSGKFKAVKAGCCEIRLVNEGDLNGDGADDISLFQAPMNGCTYTMMTYSFSDGTFTEIVALFLIPTACDFISDEKLQERIFLENDKLYFLKTDVNDEHFRLLKTAVPKR